MIEVMSVMVCRLGKETDAVAKGVRAVMERCRWRVVDVRERVSDERRDFIERSELARLPRITKVLANGLAFVIDVTRTRYKYFARSLDSDINNHLNNILPSSSRNRLTHLRHDGSHTNHCAVQEAVQEAPPRWR